MQMPVPITKLFEFPVDAILAALPDADDPLWDEFAARQNAFRVHSQTRSIPFRWTNPTSSDAHPIVTVPLATPPALAEAVTQFLDRIRDHYAGRVVIAVLAELAPGGDILPHRDSGPIHARTHRCHLPIVTNPDVDFLIDGEVFHLEPGQAYEVDNLRGHAVKNRGTGRRVHLVCSVLPSADAARAA